MEGHIPALSFLCLLLLSESPEHLHRVFGHRRLNPSYPFLPTDAHITQLYPRLWASIVQIFDHVPSTFVTYPISLFHVDLPLLQQIPQTQHFSLITLLELPGCPQVTDDFVSHFIHLHSLAALDISGTKVSYLAIKRLSQSLILETSPSSPRAWHGPWPLRILRLHNCRNIDNLIFQYLSKFPLLCFLGTLNLSVPDSLRLTRAYRYPWHPMYSTNWISSPRMGEKCR